MGGADIGMDGGALSVSSSAPALLPTRPLSQASASLRVPTGRSDAATPHMAGTLLPGVSATHGSSSGRSRQSGSRLSRISAASLKGKIQRAVQEEFARTKPTWGNYPGLK